MIVPEVVEIEGDDKIVTMEPLHRNLTFRLSRVQAKLNAQASRILNGSSGVTLTQWRVIALIGAAGQTRLSDLARDLALDKGLLSRSLKALIKDGVISASTDDSDHRAHLLSLSPKGQEIFDQTLPVTQKRQMQLKASLTEEELRVFHRVLDKLDIEADKSID